MRTLILYSTLGCHLCEEAKTLCWPVLEALDYRLQEVDIADNESLMDSYALKIPVLHHAPSRMELNWPFTQQQLADFINQLGSGVE